MNPFQRILSIAVFVLLAVSSVLAQEEKEKAREPFLVPIAEKLERATTTDESGHVQWAEYKAEPCVNCKGRKFMTCLHCERFDEGDCEKCPECHDEEHAVCRICAGTGEMPDILERAPCPTCFGAAVTRCFVCNGRGRFPVAGGGDRLQKCGCCDGVGAFPCTTCGGQRFVPTPKFKPSFADAKSSDLKKALEALEKVEEGLPAFESTRDARKDMKAWAKLLTPGFKYFPALKEAQKQFDTATKEMTKGSNWQHYPETVQASATSAKQSLEYYLKHLRRVLELVLARAEHNEELDAKKK